MTHTEDHAIDRRARKADQGRRVTLSFAVVAGLFWLGAAGWIWQQIGPGGVVIGLVLAPLVTLPALALFRWVGRWTPQPGRRMLTAFVWGAGIAAPVTLVVTPVVTWLIGSEAMKFYDPMVVTPLAEESLKGLFLVGLFVLRPRRLDGVLDVLVCTSASAVGFAFTENIWYLGRAVTAFLGSSADAEAYTLLLGSLGMRMVLTPLMHPLFTAALAFGVAVALTRRSAVVRTFWVLAGFLVSCGLHSAWDAAALLSSDSTMVFRVYAVVMVPLFIATVVFVVVARRRQGRMIGGQLPGIAVAGWIAPDQVPVLAELSLRRDQRRAVRREHGRDAARAVSDHQSAVSRLALLRAARRPRTQGDHEARLLELGRAAEHVSSFVPALRTAAR